MDWSGYVQPAHSRMHPSETPTAMRVQISPKLNAGFCPCDSAKTLDWTKPGRQCVLQTSEGNMIARKNKRSNTFSLIGGPIPIDEPSSVGSVSWESETKAALNHKGTKVGQLTSYGRSIHVRGKKRTQPAFEVVQPFNLEYHDLIRKENPYELNESPQIKYKPCDPCIEDGNLIGFRSDRGGSVKSLLSDLSTKIVDKVERKNFASTAPLAPYAMDKNTSTDPYRIYNGERKKDLLVENYNVAVPGYTGKMSFTA